jgi:hypothetical protein
VLCKGCLWQPPFRLGRVATRCTHWQCGVCFSGGGCALCDPVVASMMAHKAAWVRDCVLHKVVTVAQLHGSKSPAAQNKWIPLDAARGDLTGIPAPGEGNTGDVNDEKLVDEVELSDDDDNDEAVDPDTTGVTVKGYRSWETIVADLSAIQPPDFVPPPDATAGGAAAAAAGATDEDAMTVAGDEPAQAGAAAEVERGRLNSAVVVDASATVQQAKRRREMAELTQPCEPAPPGGGASRAIVTEAFGDPAAGACAPPAMDVDGEPSSAHPSSLTRSTRSGTVSMGGNSPRESRGTPHGHVADMEVDQVVDASSRTSSRLASRPRRVYGQGN